jgi:hypothetical protein
MGSPVQDSVKTAKQLAVDAARKMAREPLEILRQVPEQITPVSKSGTETREESKDKAEGNRPTPKEEEIKKTDLENIKKLDTEISQIRREKLFKDLTERISCGEEVFLADVAEITPEQRRVLEAQMQAVKERRLKEEVQSDQSLNISSKPSRRFLGLGAKQAAQKQTTRVERPLPPSG